MVGSAAVLKRTAIQRAFAALVFLGSAPASGQATGSPLRLDFDEFFATECAIGEAYAEARFVHYASMSEAILPAGSPFADALNAGMESIRGDDIEAALARRDELQSMLAGTTGVEREQYLAFLDRLAAGLNARGTDLEAEQVWLEAFELALMAESPGRFESYADRVIYLKSRRVDGGLEQFLIGNLPNIQARFSESSSESITWNTRIGQFYVGEGRGVDALPYLSVAYRGAKQQITDPSATIGMAYIDIAIISSMISAIHENQNDFEQAESILIDAWNILRNRPGEEYGAYYALREFYENQDRPSELERLIRQKQDVRELASWLRDDGRVGDAIAVLNEELARPPASADETLRYTRHELLITLGEMHDAQGDTEAADRYLAEAASTVPAQDYPGGFAGYSLSIRDIVRGRAERGDGLGAERLGATQIRILQEARGREDNVTIGMIGELSGLYRQLEMISQHLNLAVRLAEHDASFSNVATVAGALVSAERLPDAHRVLAALESDLLERLPGETSGDADITSDIIRIADLWELARRPDRTDSLLENLEAGAEADFAAGRSRALFTLADLAIANAEIRAARGETEAARASITGFARFVGQHVTVAQASEFIGHHLVRLGFHEDAIDFLEQAASAAVAGGVADMSSDGSFAVLDQSVPLNLATAYSQTGRFRQAEETLLQALGEYGGLRIEFRSQERFALAELYFDQARYDEAWPLYQREAEDGRCLGFMQGYVNYFPAVMRQARMTALRGDPQLAEAMLGEVIEEQERTGDQSNIDLEVLRSQLKVQAGDLATAEQAFQETLRRARVDLGDRSPVTRAIAGDLADVLAARARRDEARALFERYFSHIAGSREPFNSEMRRFAARFATFMLADPSTAHLAIEPARRLISPDRGERTRHAFDDDDSLDRDSSNSLHSALFADAAWSARAAASEDGEPISETAFAALQDAIAGPASRTLTRSLARALADRAEPGLGALAREREELLDRRTAMTERYALSFAAESAANTVDRASMGADIATISARLSQIDERMREEFPDYFALLVPEPLDIAAAQSILDDDEAILMLAPTTHGTHIVAVTQDGLRWRRSGWTATQIDEAVARLRWDAGASFNLSQELFDELRQRPSARMSFDRATAHGLHQQLVEPIADMLAGKEQLFIVTGGSLSNLPLAVLVTETPQGADDDPHALRATRWFADAHALTQLPSIQSLQLLRRPRTSSGESSIVIEFAGFGDPILPGEPRARDFGMARDTAPRGPPIFSGSQAPSGANLADVTTVGLPRIPGTAAELEGLAETLGVPISAARLRERATETAIKSADLRHTRILAFATHGLIAGQGGMAEPGLVYTPPVEASERDDGFLTASEISALHIDAEWVLLSACNTAAGDALEDSQSLSGLARAFFRAGARSILASHWPVDDGVAPRLTVRTLQIERSQPSLSRAQAFQQSMREVREDATHDTPRSTWAHPYYWAPFVLIGEGANH